MNAEDFSSTEALRFGWRTTMANLTPLVVMGAIGLFLSLVDQALTSRPGGAVLALGVQVLQSLLMMAFIRVALRLHDGGTVDWARPGELVVGFFPYLLTSVLVGLIVAGGLILLIVPGILWALTYGYAPMLTVDTNLDPIAALRESRRLTHGVRWHLLGFGLLCIGVNLLGALALGIGLVVTIPTTTLAAVQVYRRLQTREAALFARPLTTQPV